MRPNTYSVEELLDLRNIASPDSIAAVNFRDNELEMLRTKSRASSRSYNSTTSNTNTLKRSAKRTGDDSSSTTSDEVVFKGTMSRRAQRPEAAQLVQPVQPSSAATADAKVTAASASEPDQAAEWKYQGRTSSEGANNEPLSAPTGTNAQQHEGFQRFYKAVVSPTHVRVTAGGRIVPNTRNTVSPTAKRPKAGETVANGSQPEPAPAAAPKQPVPVVGMPHPMQFFYPGFHPGMSPIHPMTGMPMPMMPHGYPFSMPMPNAAAAPATQDPSLKENQIKWAGEKNMNGASEPASVKTEIKVSPPEQFDHGRPFMYNGQQWMFPMFPSPYPGYMGMPAPPGYAGPPVPGAPMMMPPPMAMAPLMGHVGPMGPMGPMGHFGHQGAMQPTVAVPVSSRQSTPQPPSQPPISSIRPSQITRKQIDGLRANLKYHEDQVLYNKHQIDEKDMENKINLLQADIDRFERVFKAQFEYEEKHYPRSDKAKEDVSSSGGRESSTKTSQSHSEESKESRATTISTHPQPKLRRKFASRDSVGLNSNKSSTASYNDEPGPERRLMVNTVRKTTLPSGAALAPVFQPRSVSALTVPVDKDPSKQWQSVKADEEITQEQLEAAEKKLVAAGARAWNMSQQVQDLASPPVQGQPSQHNHNSLGEPYLVGTLPQDANPYSVHHRIEYEYSRKLTDEELQARHLYWGKAPCSVSQGLPKYDGRNFYPPSPAKNAPSSGSPQRANMPVGVPEVEYRFPPQSGKGVEVSPVVALNNNLLKVEEADGVSNGPSVSPSPSFLSQAEDHTEEFEKALAESKSSEMESEGSRCKDVSETRSADYHDSRINGAASRIWHSMLKRGLTTSEVLPSAVSSTTAQGYLPQFTGHAAASLSPTISGTISSPSRGSPAKDNDTNTNGTSTFMTQKVVENCPPAPTERLSDTLLNMVGIKASAWAG